MGGAGVATSDSSDACFYNPAGLSRLQGPQANFGLIAYRPFLYINGASSPANQTKALWSLGFATPIPLGQAVRIYFGLDAALPGLTLYSVRAFPRSEPHFLFFENRNERLALDAAVAAMPVRWLAIGAGFSLLPQVFGEVRVDFAGKGERSYTNVDVKAKLSPNVGVLIIPVDTVSIGIAWRGASSTKIRIPTSVDVADIPPIRLKVEAPEFWTPHQVSLGVAWHAKDLMATAEFSYSFYEDFEYSAPTVTLYGSSGEVSRFQAVSRPGFRNTVSVRAGGEWHLSALWSLRFGVAFLQSPVPAQTGEANLLDGHRFLLAAGVGLDFEAVGGPPLRLDGQVSWVRLASNHDEKLIFDVSNPGFPSIRSSGSVLSGALDLGVRFW